MRRAQWFVALTSVAGLATGCLMPTVEEDGAKLGIAWDCQTGTPEEIATCKSDYSKRFPGQRKFESAASWRHMWRDQLLESARSSDAKQVIEESDIFKVEGTTLYALNPYRGLFVIDITNVDAPRILAREPVYGHAEDMYVRGGNAYILFNDYYRWDYGDEAFQGAQIVVVRIADSGNGNSRRVTTQVAGQYGLDGWLTDSRLVYEDGGEHRARLYVISNDTRYYGNWWDDDEENGGVVNNTHILSLNVTDPANIREADRLTVEGAGHVVSATTDYIFVGSQDWSTQKSQIQIINIQDRDGDIAPGASVEVDGYIRHRFDMDYRNGRLRVVSHDWSWDPEEGSSGDIHVTTYDAANMMTKGHQLDLVGVGSLEATRFADDRVYLVHVQRIDPIEIVDLSNPAELRSVGELEIPGWIEHLEIRGDTVLGVGYDQGNTTVPQRRCEGYTLDGQTLAADAAFPEVPEGGQKISLSAYDVADPAALCEASRTRFGVGDWPYGNFEDDKTLRLYDTDADGVDDLFLIPWESYDDEATEGEQQQINAVSLVDVAYGTGTARVNARGRIDSIGSIERAFPARGRLLTLGDRELIVANIADRDHPAVTSRLEMARNVQAFATVGQFGVQLVSDWDSPAAELRIVPLDDPDAERGAARSTIEVRDEAGNKLEAEELYTSGRIVTVVGRQWKYEEYDDNNDGETDRWEDHFEVRFTNFQVNAQGRISFGGTLALPLVTDGGAAQKFADLKDIIRLRPDMFVVTAPDGLFRAVSTKNAVPAVTHTEPAPYGAYGIEDLRTFDGNDVYAVTWQPVQARVEEADADVTLGTRDANGNLTKATRRVRPRAERVAYFVTKVTLNAQGVPTNARYRINVPGRLIDVAEANGEESWTLLDSRWRTDQDNFRQERAIFTVDVTPLHATLLDGAQIGSGVEDIRVVSDGGDRRAAYLVDNNAWSGPIVPLNADGTAAEQETAPHLIVIDLTQPSEVRELARMQLPGHYAYMREVAQFGARRYAFLSLGWGGGMAVVDVTNGATPVMDQFVRSNGGVWDIQVNSDRDEVYFAAGMFGVQSVRVGHHSGAN